MNNEALLSAIGEIDGNLIQSAAVTPKRKKSPWVRFGAVAACLAFAAALGVGLLHGGVLGGPVDVATLDNGDRITFVPAKSFDGSGSLDLDITAKPLTEAEAEALFAGLSGTANAVFLNGEGSGAELIGYEGKIGNVKAVISTSDVKLCDTVIEGAEKTSEIGDVGIAAGYFVTDPNSKGEQNAVYYVTFASGAFEIYLENSGTKAESEETKKQLAEIVQALIENGDLKIQTSED